MIEELNPLYGGNIVTTIEDPGKFYEAESYHQNYYDTHPNQGYCQFVIAPKLQKFQEKFKEYLR